MNLILKTLAWRNEKGETGLTKMIEMTVKNLLNPRITFWMLGFSDDFLHLNKEAKLNIFVSILWLTPLSRARTSRCQGGDFRVSKWIQSKLHIKLRLNYIVNLCVLLKGLTKPRPLLGCIICTTWFTLHTACLQQSPYYALHFWKFYAKCHNLRKSPQTIRSMLTVMLFTGLCR